MTHFVASIPNLAQCHIFTTSQSTPTSKFDLQSTKFVMHSVFKQISYFPRKFSFGHDQTVKIPHLISSIIVCICGIQGSVKDHLFKQGVEIGTWTPLSARNCLKFAIFKSPTRTDLCGGAALERGSKDRVPFSVLPTSESTQAVS